MVTCQQFFWSSYQIIVNRKVDSIEVIPHISSGSVARYSFTLMQHMTMEQLKIIEKDGLLVKTPVTGADIHHRIGQGGNTAPHKHF